MLSFHRTKANEQARPMLTIKSVQAETVDPLDMLRMMKQQYPQAWQQVAMEIIVPAPGANGVDRLLNRDGKPEGK